MDRSLLAKPLMGAGAVLVAAGVVLLVSDGDDEATVDLDGGDADTLLTRMNQATFDRYGTDQCEAYADSVAGTALDATLLATRDIASWDCTAAGVTTTLADVVGADIERTVNEQTVPQTTHWQLVDDRYTWFTDYGTPV
jgi:hypothetical protein